MTANFKVGGRYVRLRESLRIARPEISHYWTVEPRIPGSAGPRDRPSVGGGDAYIGTSMLSPESRDNNKIVRMTTMDTTRLNRKDLARHLSTTTGSPWIPRTQP